MQPVDLSQSSNPLGDLVKPKPVTPKEHLLELCSKDLEEYYIFTKPEGQGKLFVDAIRTAMSRFRKKARAYGYNLPAFKIKTINIHVENGMDVITLARTKPGATINAKHDIDRVMQQLNKATGGE